jgi:hypothetical protein
MTRDVENVATETIDLNHPLARAPLTVAARIHRRDGVADEHGGRCNDVAIDVLDTGAGLEALHAPGSTDFFSWSAYERLDPCQNERCYENARQVLHIDSRASGISGQSTTDFLNRVSGCWT